ncbi:MAG: hypothetical protein CL666_08475 [Balneola sp.]|nr:hypothetical protein [Balneola sp.]|tara:strand:- start:41450 stop:41896 length:447 start_codon:yes stop_codon:yes gene_type:complete
MNTQTFINTLVSNANKNLSFILPDDTRLSGDLHITEIQNHKVDSVDCGGNSHQYDETVVQLWINEASKDIAAWRTEKALKIFEIVGKKIEYKDEADLLIEFGDSAHPTIRYSVGRIVETSKDVTIMLTVKPTVCKPRLNITGKLAGCC